MTSEGESASVGVRGFARLPRAARVTIVVLGAMVAVNLAARALESSVGGSEPAGRRGSAYATAPDGLAAFAELLRRNGHAVERRRGPLDEGRIDAAATLFVISPDTLAPGEESAVADFVDAGGRLVVGGSTPGRYIGGFGSDPPRWDTEAPETWNVVDASLAPVGEVEAGGNGSWVDLGQSTALVGEAEGDRSLLTVAEVGRGEIMYLADAEPLENRGLAVADNAALALALAGEEGRPVVFAEGVHGFGASTGWVAIPGGWKLSLGGLAVAALVFMWARSNRLGPPERSSRPLPPPRREHVAALGATLARTGSRAEQAAPVQAAVRSRLAAREGLGPDAPDDDLDRAGISAGLDEDERRATLGSVETVEDLLAVGRALARLSAHDGGGRR